MNKKRLACIRAIEDATCRFLLVPGYEDTWDQVGPCAKTTTTCTIYGGRHGVYVGKNWCLNPQSSCPREPGEGYEKCKTICQQIGHAEEVAVMVAQGDINEDSFAVLEGHTYYCQNCQETLFDAGVKSLQRAD